jgi:hypothetical protein
MGASDRAGLCPANALAAFVFRSASSHKSAVVFCFALQAGPITHKKTRSAQSYNGIISALAKFISRLQAESQISA